MNRTIAQGAGSRAGDARLMLAPLVAVALVGAMILMNQAAPGVCGSVLALISAAALIGVLANARARHVLSGISGWTLPAIVFGLALLALILGLTPFAPGGVHPFWSWVGPGAAALDKQTGLEGLVALIGLGGLFLLSATVGARAERARQATLALQGVTLMTALGLSVLWFAAGRAGETAAPWYAGLALILAAAVMIQTAKAERPRRWIGRLTAAPASAATAVISAILLVLTGGLAAFAAAGFALAMFGGWEALAKRGEGKLRREPMLITLGLMTLAAAAVFGSILLLGLPQAGSDASTANLVHWRAFFASPWLGYGPGSVEAVARLSTDRLNLSALIVHPWPASGYIAALEQGGVLVAVPLVASLALIGWTLVDASVRRRRLTTLYRAAVCSLGFAALLAFASTALVTVAGAAPLVLLLGVCFGAARGGR